MPKIYYHYCSSETFYAILSNKSIRLSSMSLSNDALEGRMVEETFKKLSTDYSIQAVYQHLIPELMERINMEYDGLAFCLSEERDLLSQWRGYADDGHGYSIGFSEDFLKSFDQTASWSDWFFKTPVQLEKVLYEEDEHKDVVRETFLAMQSYIDSIHARKTRKSPEDQAGESIEEGLGDTVLRLVNKLFTLKSRAFAEEREWRLLSTVKTANYQYNSFGVRRNTLVPFQKLDFPKNNLPAIVEVIQGPKNRTPKAVLSSFLKANGFEGAEIDSSAASYR